MITTGLAFSGGKDAWACLFHVRKKLDKILVIWIDTGKNYPELLESIDKAERLCPNFVRVRVDRVGQNDYQGLPSDIVPVNWTRLGQECTGKKEVLVQSYLSCCYENIASNLTKFCKQNGITTLINGQRNGDRNKSTSRNGDVVFGIRRVQPIEKWTEEQVYEFISRFMELPDHFKFKHSSMDCYDCTAYRKDTQDISWHRRLNWPLLHEEYENRKSLLDNALIEALYEG